MPTADIVGANAAIAWWIWPIALFLTTFALGIVAVLSGVGGGVLFVPIVGSFFPFHLDFVRGIGLLFALAGTLAAGPMLLRYRMASLRLAMPLALAGSVASFAGALVGLALPTDLVQTALGLTVLGIAALLWHARHTNVGVADSLREHLHGHACSKGGRGVAMSQIVQPDRR